jgi:excisionase family DNA binding protein
MGKRTQCTTVACMDTPQKILFSKKEAAQALSISLRSLEYLIARKELPTRHIGKRVLVPVSALQQFARRDHANTPTIHSAVPGNE